MEIQGANSLKNKAFDAKFSTALSQKSEKPIEDVVFISAKGDNSEEIGEQARLKALAGAQPGIGRKFPPGEPVSGGTYTGKINIHKKFHSEILGNDRNVLVFLPPGYSEKNAEKYPVLYMNDGQNLFNRETAFGGNEWCVDETAQRLMLEGKIKEVIIVAVENTDRRMWEYTQAFDQEVGAGGKSLDYGRFLMEEVKPMIDSDYKTTNSAKETGIAGSSLGGLSAIHLSWTFPNTFGIMGALSPSIWFANKDIINRISSDPREKGPSKIWINIGTRESGDSPNSLTHVYNAREMGNVFLKKNYTPEKDIFYREIPGGGHSENDWGQVFGQFLMTMFPKE